MKRYVKSFAEMIPARNGAWTTHQQAEKAVRTAVNSRLSVILKRLRESGVTEYFPNLEQDIEDMKVK
jgi:hypothetical protein